MNVKERLLTLKLLEKQEDNLEYMNKIGVHVTVKGAEEKWKQNSGSKHYTDHIPTTSAAIADITNVV